MRKATINYPINNLEKVAASDFSIEVHHKGKAPVILSTTQYTYSDVFDYIKEQYEHDLDSIQKISIELVR